MVTVFNAMIEYGSSVETVVYTIALGLKCFFVYISFFVKLICHRVASFNLMGSLGWHRCHWCSKWQYNMYIPDGIDGPLCGTCIDRSIEVGTPPEPTGRSECCEALQQQPWLPSSFPKEVMILVSKFLVCHLEPGRRNPERLRNLQIKLVGALDALDPEMTSWKRMRLE